VSLQLFIAQSFIYFLCVLAPLLWCIQKYVHSVTGTELPFRVNLSSLILSVLGIGIGLTIQLSVQRMPSWWSVLASAPFSFGAVSALERSIGTRTKGNEVNDVK
jgi:hypothetical protein